MHRDRSPPFRPNRAAPQRLREVPMCAAQPHSPTRMERTAAYGRHRAARITIVERSTVPSRIGHAQLIRLDRLDVMERSLEHRVLPRYDHTHEGPAGPLRTPPQLAAYCGPQRRRRNWQGWCYPNFISDESDSRPTGPPTAVQQCCVLSRL